jgi:hypothetical protein
VTTIECYGYDKEGVLRVFQTRTFPTLLTVAETFELFDEMDRTATLFGWRAARSQVVSMRHE